MRARNSRLVVAAVVATGLIAPWTGSAHATAARTVVVHTGLPHGFVLQGEQCGSTDFGGTFEAVHVTGPAKPPLGKGSLALEGHSSIVLSTPLSTQAAANLTALSFSYTEAARSTSPPPVYAQIDLNDNSTAQSYDSLSIAIQPTRQWTSLDLLTATLEASHTVGTTSTDDGATTWAQFLTAHPGSTVNDAFLQVLNCENFVGSGVALDALSYGLKGATTTYDFEPDSALRLTASGPRTSHKGVPVAITGFLDRGKAAIPGLSILLQAKAKGAKTWTDTATVTTRYNGALYDVELPTTTTSFRWTYPGSTDAGPITSKAITVRIVKPANKKHRK